ncbi:hypothetical protein NQ317_019783, partial [Molorchus minor]
MSVADEHIGWSENNEYDYDGEYTLPSNGPPPIQEPPGAFSGATSPREDHLACAWASWASRRLYFSASGDPCNRISSVP